MLHLIISLPRLVDSVDPNLQYMKETIVLLKKHIKHCILKIANVIDKIASYCFISSFLLNVKFIGNKI